MMTAAALGVLVSMGGCLSSGGAGGGSTQSGTSTSVSSVSTSIISGADVTAQPTTTADAVRFLQQASFGPTPGTVDDVRQKGRALALEEQFAKPAYRFEGIAPNFVVSVTDICDWATNPDGCLQKNFSAEPVRFQFFRNAVHGEDQLRQRVALALAQILVVSVREITQAHAIANFHQLLVDNAFGNYRDLIGAVARSPVMGTYLNLVNNAKADPSRGTRPNQNFARELMQLFTTGTVLLNADGTPVRAPDGRAVPAYGPDEILETSRVLTGWTFAPRPGASAQWNALYNYTQPMIAIQDQHDTGSKRIIGGRVIPSGQSAEKDAEDLIDALITHPNTGVFVGRQLIQHLVTSNPDPAYVARVASVFRNNGFGVAGDMKAVLRAILLDPEARGEFRGAARYGKLKEPVLLATNLARALGVTTNGVFFASWCQYMGQPVFEANNVFSFYTPDYRMPGSNLDSPSAKLLTTGGTLARSNFLYETFFSNAWARVMRSWEGPATQVDFSWLNAYAGDASQLVDAVVQRLLYGDIPATTRDIVVNAIGAIPASDPDTRVRMALYLVTNAPQYQFTR